MTRTFLLTSVLLAACGPSQLDWEVSEPGDLARDITLALLFPVFDPSQDLRLEVRGPHPQGALVRVEATHPRRRGKLERVDFETDAVLAIEGSVLSEDSRTELLDVRCVEEGVGEVRALRAGNGKVFDTVELECVAVDDVELHAFERIRTGLTEDLPSTVFVATNTTVDLVATFESEGTAMVGEDLLRVDIADPSGIAVSLPGQIQGAEALQIDTLGVSAGDSATVAVGTLADPSVRSLLVVAIDAAEVDRVALSVGKAERLLAESFVGSDRILGVDLEWRQDGTVVGDGNWVELTGDVPTDVQACVPGTDICDSLSVVGEIAFVGDGSPRFYCGCDQRNGTPGLLLGSLGLLLAGIRRRAS
jgi:hypothetical protein